MMFFEMWVEANFPEVLRYNRPEVLYLPVCASPPEYKYQPLTHLTGYFK